MLFSVATFVLSAQPNKNNVKSNVNSIFFGIVCSPNYHNPTLRLTKHGQQFQKDVKEYEGGVAMTLLEKIIFFIGIVITMITSIYTQKTTTYVGIIDRIENDDTVVVLIENRLEEFLFASDRYAGDWAEGMEIMIKLRHNEIEKVKVLD